MDERTILNEGGVTVTTSRIVINGKTYATRNVSAVALHQKQPSIGTLFLAIVGIGLCLRGEYVWGGLALAWAIAYAWMLVSGRTLLMTAGGGELAAMTTHNKGKAQRVHDAIAEAISAR